MDLMTGMGEAWLYILPKIGKNGQLVALDFCQPMLDFAKKRQQNFPKNSIEILCENALQSSILDGSADAVISTFGLKTLSPEQLENFAIEIFRVLKPGGTFSMVEVSVPKNAVLQAFYLF